MPTEQRHTTTGYSVLRVKEATRVRFEQLMQQTGKITHDEMLTLLIERYEQSQAGERQQDDALQA